MYQRLQIGLIVILLVAVVALGYQSYSAQRANQAALADVAQKLAQLGSERAATSTDHRPGAPPAWDADRPRVVETFPANGAADVDPATNEIRVTFDAK